MSADDLELRVSWQRHLDGSAAAERWLESIIDRHRAPGRHYHDVRHVRWVIRHITTFVDRLDDAGAAIAAGFFHDAVYDPTAHDNERASAELAAHALAELGWRGDRIDRVASMILATADHHVPGPDIDHDVVLAADLAVLGAGPGAYGDYVRNVRREYSHLDDDAWRVGRATVLREFLARERIFSPRLGLDRWERRARANLTAELADLTA